MFWESSNYDSILKMLQSHNDFILVILYLFIYSFLTAFSGTKMLSDNMEPIYHPTENNYVMQ